MKKIYILFITLTIHWLFYFWNLKYIYHYHRAIKLKKRQFFKCYSMFNLLNHQSTKKIKMILKCLIQREMVNRFGGRWWDFGGRVAISSQFHIVHTSYVWLSSYQRRTFGFFYEGFCANIYADSKISPPYQTTFFSAY